MLGYTTPKPNDYQEATNTAVVLTFASTADERHAFSRVIFSYSGTPTAGSYFQVEVTKPGVGNTNWSVVRKYYISAAGPGPVVHNLVTELGQGLRLTLSAGGSGIVGCISVDGLQHGLLPGI